ncbi:MAG: hypothetical protein ACI8RD_014090, partial [Bacillariaceae sp.]
RRNVNNKINVEKYENQLQQRGRRRGRRRRSQSQSQIHFRLQKAVLLLIASSCILQHRSCNGSDPSSFRRNPPPPPPPPLSRGFDNIIDDNNYGQNSNGIIDDNYNTQQQQAQQYPDEYGYYGNSGGPPPPQSATDFSSSSSTNPPQQQQQQQQQRPSLPIHYEFPITSADDDKGKDLKEGRRIKKINNDDDEDDNNFKSTSARTDLVTKYWSKKIGKVQIQTIIGLIGYASGSFVAKVNTHIFPCVSSKNHILERLNTICQIFYRLLLTPYLYDSYHDIIVTGWRIRNSSMDGLLLGVLFGRIYMVPNAGWRAISSAGIESNSCFTKNTTNS